MSNVIELPVSEHRYDEASLWIAKLDRTLTHEEEAQLKQWLHAHPDNHTIFLKMAALWDKMDRLALLSELFPQEKIQQPRRLPMFAAAASIAVCVMGIAWSFIPSTPNASAIWNAQRDDVVTIIDGSYETAVGEKDTIKLPDGSTLVLNTNSLIKVVYTNKQRLLILDRGEIHIDVAHDQERPLSVVAGKKIMQAVGTAFDVHLFGDKKVELIVTDGRVLVAERQDINARTPLSNIKRLAGSAVSVSRGEKIILGAAKEVVAKIDAKEMAAQLSWQQGNVVLRGETLEEAVAEFSRYNNMQFIIADEKIKNIRIAGLFKTDDIESFLQALSSNFPITYQKMSDNKVLLHAR
jgi:transmembrane sensor